MDRYENDGEVYGIETQLSDVTPIAGDSNAQNAEKGKGLDPVVRTRKVSMKDREDAEARLFEIWTPSRPVRIPKVLSLWKW